MNSVIATTPAGMIAAQGQMQEWIDGKLEVARQELRDADEVSDAVRRYGLQASGATARQKSAARARILFYEKVKAALDAGYYIIPPFPVQEFAIRVPYGNMPPEAVSTRPSAIDYQASKLPVGEGLYVDPVAPRVRTGTTTTQKDYQGKETQVALYRNVENWRDLNLPSRALKPTLIAATAKALGELIFDSLGIAPAYRSADPMIVGHIRSWQRYGSPLTFFVAWWMDQEDL